MRTLTASHKKILDQYTEILHYDDLPVEARVKLVKAGDYETLWSDATRYLGDQFFARQREATTLPATVWPEL